MIDNELQALSKKYQILFAEALTSALDEIAKAKLQEESPIAGLVFHRNALVVNKKKCKLIADFAERYSEKLTVVVNMIWNDQDVKAKGCAVNKRYCKIDDWKGVEVIFDNSLK